MKLRIIAIVATLAMFSVPHVSAGGSAIAEIAKVEVVGIRNFTQIDGSSGFAGPHAGFGGATQSSAMAFLKSKGIATVINLRLASEEDVDLKGSVTAAEAAGLNYIHLPFDAANPAPGVVDKFLATVGNEANQPVYIHCASATRAAALWMIGRVMEDGWEIDAASAEAERIALKPPEAIAFASAYIKSTGK